MARGPGVSVVIPCFNAQATVGDAVESALSQAGDIQVIAVNDGSSDGTAGVLARYSERITVVSGPNRGVSAARNAGIALCTGAWTLFLDADDVLTPGTVASRLRAAGETDDVVISRWRDWQEGGTAEGGGRVRGVDEAALRSSAELAIARDLWAPPAALLYRTNLVHAIGGFSPELPVIQDARFLFDAARRGASFACSPHVGAIYRVSSASLSRRDPAAFSADVLLNGRQIEAVWRARGPLSSDHQAVLHAIYGTATGGLLQACDPRVFEAAACMRPFGSLPWRARLALPLASGLGLRRARDLAATVAGLRRLGRTVLGGERSGR